MSPIQPADANTRLILMTMAASPLMFCLIVAIGVIPVPTTPGDPILATTLFVIGATMLFAGPLLGNAVAKRNPGPTALIVRYGIWEGAAMVGFVHHVISGETTTCFILCFAAFMAMVMNIPRSAE